MSFTLLDVDADFMLDRDCNWSWCSNNARSKSRAIVSGTTLGKALKPFVKKDTDIILEIDHHESLFWWDCYDVRNALCIHIDAHHDMWSNWGIKPGRRDLVDCGSYLQQALFDKVVDRVIFVPSSFRSLAHERADIQENFERRVKPDRVQVRPWDVFKRHTQDYPKADIITISISPEWFPSKHWHQVENLSKVLGVKKNIIQQTKIKAFQKWNAMKTGRIWRWGQKDFEFPYKRIGSCALKRLRENLKVEKVK